MSGVRFEKRDINERSSFWFGVWILAGMFVVALLMKPLYSLLAGREDARQAPAAYVAGADEGALEPPGPRLQTRPELDLAAFRAQEDSILESYAWVDKEQGVVRIPISQAMRLVVERGLPVFAEEVPADEGSEDEGEAP